MVIGLYWLIPRMILPLSARVFRHLDPIPEFWHLAKLLALTELFPNRAGLVNLPYKILCIVPAAISPSIKWALLFICRILNAFGV